MSEPKLRKTTDYSRFEHLEINRNVRFNTSSKRRLRESMKRYGWMPSYPMKIRKNGSGKYFIDDGQHRLQIAKEYGLTVYYVIDNTDIDISFLNNTGSKWGLEDHLNRWVKEGYDDYVYLQHFYNRYGIALSVSISLLTDCSSHKTDKFKAGEFVIKDKGKANDLAKAILELQDINRTLNGKYFISAIILCSKVEQFSLNRFVEKCRVHAGKIHNCGDVDSYLEMLDEIYNYHQTDKIPLKFLAEEAKRKES